MLADLKLAAAEAAAVSSIGLVLFSLLEHILILLVMVVSMLFQQEGMETLVVILHLPSQEVIHMVI